MAVKERVERPVQTIKAIVAPLSNDLKTNKIYLFGLDGYDMKTDEQMIEVSKENQLRIC